MKAKFLIIALTLLALAGGGAFALYQSGKAPDLAQIRANPALFQFKDYKDKVALHTRLSTLFPRGTQEENITKFFSAAGHDSSTASKADCLITHRYSRARFHLSASERKLVTIQVLDENGLLWPNFVPDCSEPRINAPEQGKTEVLTPDSASAEQPIYLPLEPIPGVE